MPVDPYGRTKAKRLQMPAWKTYRALEMRSNPTRAEDRMWFLLKQAKLGYKWRRQRPMFGYIVDFWCFAAQVIVEIDGPSHEDRRHIDQRRDNQFAARGILTIRVSNDEVFRAPGDVISCIKSSCEQRIAERSWLNNKTSVR